MILAGPSRSLATLPLGGGRSMRGTKYHEARSPCPEPRTWGAPLRCAVASDCSYGVSSASESDSGVLQSRAEPACKFHDQAPASDGCVRALAKVPQPSARLPLARFRLFYARAWFLLGREISIQLQFFPTKLLKQVSEKQPRHACFQKNARLPFLSDLFRILYIITTLPDQITQAGE